MPDEYGLQILGLLHHVDCPVEDLDGICMASVVPPLTSRIKQACTQYLQKTPFIVDHTSKTGVNIHYEDPSAVGVDRIVDAAAVIAIYGCPACVIDFGTATTFNAIDVSGNYLGGAIAPGILVSSNALVMHTSKLPLIDLQPPPSVIGRNTVHAMQSGLIFGYVSMVEGMLARFRLELGDDMKVIATGGLAEIVAHETSAIQQVSPWLTLEGLRIIWEMNRK
jgi:type III pantothenate kinase